MATFSLVHGGQQGAWCFEPLIAELTGSATARSRSTYRTATRPPEARSTPTPSWSPSRESTMRRSSSGTRSAG